MARALIISAIAAAEADAPAGHVVALAHRRELDAHVDRAGRGQKARRLVAVERHVGVGEIADHHEAVPAWPASRPRRKNGCSTHGRRRIVRVVEDHAASAAGTGARRCRRCSTGTSRCRALPARSRCRTPAPPSRRGSGKYGAGTIAVSPGPIIARHMWLKPSFEPRQTITSSSGSSRTPNCLKYFAATSRRRLAMPFDLL